jgi:hypothetical protein
MIMAKDPRREDVNLFGNAMRIVNEAKIKVDLLDSQWMLHDILKLVKDKEFHKPLIESAIGKCFSVLRDLNVLVYHSQSPDNHRVKVWYKRKEINKYKDLSEMQLRKIVEKKKKKKKKKKAKKKGGKKNVG